MQAILIQPPFTQLNTPYPAIHYLEAFLRGQGLETAAFDHSIELYRLLFSRKGLERIFAEIETGQKAWKGDETARREIERYLSYEPLYLEWIDGIVAFLAGEDRAFAHRLASAAELPQGARAAAYLAADDGRIRSEEAAGLATAILEDLADLIRYALDPNFGTVRYGDRLARSRGDFGEVEAALDSAWFIHSIYAPWLRGFWAAQAKDLAADTGREAILVLVTIPFPGCLAGALACARAAREALGDRACIVFGGGYVSTELRGLSDPRLFDYCDYLSFDSGYGSLASIIGRLGDADGKGASAPLYKTMLRDGGSVKAEGLDGGPGAEWAAFAKVEDDALTRVSPDYASVDYGRYLGAMDSDNPMHRLWSDSPWLKYSLAHGCYWHRCSFCDTELDYVANFRPAAIEPLMEAADRASRRHGLYGVHFVDEAMPMASLLAFAVANRERAARGERPFHFWGNVRFDASWTEGRCEFLAASGLEAVSGGVEIATDAGLAMTNKGFSLAALVKTLVGMRRAGLLVHAYLIYGFPGQGFADIVDSAELVRELFASGLIDSAFWHRFVLTRGSSIMAEWRAGKRPGLSPIDRGGSFAANDLEFEGEAAFDVFDAPLAAVLEAWMSGEGLDLPARESLAQAGLPSSALGPAAHGASPARGTGRDARRGKDDMGRVEGLIAAAEAELDKERLAAPRGRCHWVAGKADVRGAETARRGKAKARLVWAYRGECAELEGPEDELARLAETLALAARPEGIDAADLLSRLDATRDRLSALKSAGLVFV
jgi:hypothetical protein